MNYNFFVELTPDELDNLKKLSDKDVVRLDFEFSEGYEEVVNRLYELGKKNKVELYFETYSDIDINLLTRIAKYNDIYLVVNEDKVSVKEYIRLEKTLWNLIEPAKNLSPFEKYIYAYNKVKKFKKYKEAKDQNQNYTETTDLYKILENDYIVCSGFSKLLENLLLKLGIKCTSIPLSVDNSYDNIKGELSEIEPELISTKCEEHERLLVYLKDSGYNIDGYYIADPTWDNYLENDYYNHLAMTGIEASAERRYMWFELNDVTELFDVDSLDHFYTKIKILMSKSQQYKEIDAVIVDLIAKIEILDYDFYEKIEDKYNTFDGYKNIPELLEELGNYIVNHTNKQISGQTIMSAVENVYKLTSNISKEKVYTMINDIIEQNKAKQKISFPLRYKMYDDGRKEVYDNEYNKFDIEYNRRKK